MNPDTTRSLLITALTLGALALLAAAYFSPIWWVSLKAPQYPPEAFPQGIRIHFHMDGVFSGCEKRVSEEIQEEEALNCKHEMDAINHYVGMYPIAAGGPVEKALSPFSFALLGLMLIAFIIPKRGLRVTALAAGCIAISVWMSAAVYTKGGVTLLSPGYLSDIQGTMDLDWDEIEDWTAFEAMQESYQDALARYFPDPVGDKRKLAILGTATHVGVGFLIGAMVLLAVGVWMFRPFYWLLIIVPALLPLIFVVDYATWLWWFGHNLNAMGAFTVKDFMPTVFGDGKVAQFSTHSYPHNGFLMLVGASVLMAVAGVMRRNQMIENERE